MLRLSSKYLIEESIRNKALAHLRTAWPSSLRAWDLREDVARSHEVETGQSRGHRYANPIVRPTFLYLRATHGPNAQAVINLAREIGADELLPSAFYELSRYTFTQIFEPSPSDPLHTQTPPYLPSSPIAGLPNPDTTLSLRRPILLLHPNPRTHRRPLSHPWPRP